MGSLVGTPQYARQLAALEALQIYAPLGHGLGLQPLCAQLEDRCFQVCSCAAMHSLFPPTLLHQGTMWNPDVKCSSNVSEN